VTSSCVALPTSACGSKTNIVFNRGELLGEFQMIRREAFTRLGRLREDLVTIEDADRFSRLSKIGKTMIDPELMVLHSDRRAHQVGAHA